MARSAARSINLPAEGFVRLPQVIAATGLSRASVYNLMASGWLARPVKCGTAALWRVEDVRKLLRRIEQGEMEGVSLG